MKTLFLSKHLLCVALCLSMLVLASSDSQMPASAESMNQNHLKGSHTTDPVQKLKDILDSTAQPATLAGQSPSAKSTPDSTASNIIKETLHSFRSLDNPRDLDDQPNTDPKPQNIDRSPSNYRTAKYTFHVIAHTHDDPGWLNTYMEYYNGQMTRSCAKCELDLFYGLLKDNRTRTISYGEICNFFLWYNEKSEDQKVMIKDMVATKQLYFPNGGWVQNDEACVYYEDTIEQFTLGHRFLHQEFGYLPSIGWSIDPFGHSSTHAYLLAQMGMKTASFGRYNYKEHAKRLAENKLTFIWLTYDNFPEWNILGQAEFDVYGIYKSYQLHHALWPSGSQDSLNNIHEIQKQAAQANSRHIFFQIGGDFAWSYYNQNLYYSMESFVNFINGMKDPDYQALMSTPDIWGEHWYDCYNTTPSIHMSIKTDDLFPYADMDNGFPTYWTGFFTSRFILKDKVRYHGRFLQAMKKFMTGQLLSLPAEQTGSLFNEWDKATNTLEQALSLVQHHDGITGTSRKRVNEDYISRMETGFGECWKAMIKAMELTDKVALGGQSVEIGRTFNADYKYSSIDFRTYSSWLNSDVSNRTLLVRVFNPGQSRTGIHRIKIPHRNLQVFNASGKPAEFEIVCAPDYYSGSTTEDCDLYINDFFPSYSTRYYFLRNATSGNQPQVPTETVVNAGQTALIDLPNHSSFKIHSDNKTFTFKFCKSDGSDCIEETVFLDYLYYDSAIGRGSASGIYAMRFKSQDKKNLTSITRCSYFKGKYITLIQVVYVLDNSEVQAVMSIVLKNYDLRNGIQIDTFVDSLNSVANNEGKEVVIFAKSHSIKNPRTYKTDSNGLLMIPRTVDTYPNFVIDKDEPQIEANYQPIVAGIVITDPTTTKTMGILNDRSQGATSYREGEIEIMIYRRIFNDDTKGNDEFMTDTEHKMDYKTGKTVEVPQRLKCTHHLIFAESGFYNKFRAKQVERDNQFITIYQELNATSLPVFAGKHEINTKKDPLPPYVQVHVRQYSPDEAYIRLVNLHDTRVANDVSLVDSKGHIPVLSHLAGGHVSGLKVEEVSLNTIRSRRDVLDTKFKFRELDLFDTESLLIKDFSNFKMRPFELLTFKVTGLSADNSAEAKTHLTQAVSWSSVPQVLSDLEETDPEFNLAKYWEGLGAQPYQPWPRAHNQTTPNTTTNATSNTTSNTTNHTTTNTTSNTTTPNTTKNTTNHTTGNTTGNATKNATNQTTTPTKNTTSNTTTTNTTKNTTNHTTGNTTGNTTKNTTNQTNTTENPPEGGNGQISLLDRLKSNVVVLAAVGGAAIFTLIMIIVCIVRYVKNRKNDHVLQINVDENEAVGSENDLSVDVPYKDKVPMRKI